MDFKKALGVNISQISAKKGDPADIFLSMDIGSTQTRVMNFNLEGEFSDICAIESDFAIIDKDIAYIASPDFSILGNLEAILIDETASSKNESQFTELHIIKEKLVRTVGGISQATTANASKIDQQPTYVNAVFNTALAIALKAIENHVNPEFTTVDLSVSLPPEDTTSIGRMNIFKNRLSGVYTVKFPRLNLTVKFEIKPDRIFIMSESNAVATFIAMATEVGPSEDDIYGFIDIGGRSAGNSFIIDGTLVEDRCTTTPVGGLTMLNDVAQLVATKLNIQPPTQAMIKAAIPTGELKIGAKRLDISDCITQAKQNLARPVFDSFMQALDSNHLQAQQVTRVYCSGRTFGDSKRDGTVVSSSVMSFLEAAYLQRSPYTEFVRISEEYPIVTGLIYMRFGKLNA